MGLFFAKRRPLLRAGTFGAIGAVAASRVRRLGRRPGTRWDLGPVQVVVLGYSDDRLLAEVLPRLRRLRQHGVIRLVDLVLVSKDDDGLVTRAEPGELSADDAARARSLAGALLGFGPRGADGTWPAFDVLADAVGSPRDGRTWVVADTIPPGTSAAVALIEHRWAIPLRDAVARGGGVALEDTWVHPEDLLAANVVVDGVGREHVGLDTFPVDAEAQPS